MVGAILTSCAGVTIKNHFLCGSLGSQGCAGDWLFNDADHQPKLMNLQEFAVWWDDLTDPKVATSISTILDWKGDLEKLCTDTPGICSKEAEARVDALAAKMGKATVSIKTK